MVVRASPIPLYIQIEEELRGMIAAGELGPMAQVPSEAELSERAGDPARAAASYRRALDLPCPAPVRRRMQERLRRLEA